MCVGQELADIVLHRGVEHTEFRDVHRSSVPAASNVVVKSSPEVITRRATKVVCSQRPSWPRPLGNLIGFEDVQSVIFIIVNQGFLSMSFPEGGEILLWLRAFEARSFAQ